MSKHRATSANASPRTPAGQHLLVTLGILAALTLAVIGCVSRSPENRGLEAIPAPGDTADVGTMVASPEALALGQRIIRFDNTGTAADRAARRKDADVRMTVACGGDFRTGAEGPAAVHGVVSPRRDAAHRQQSPFWYIQYVCVPDQNAPPSRP